MKLSLGICESANIKYMEWKIGHVEIQREGICESANLKYMEWKIGHVQIQTSIDSSSEMGLDLRWLGFWYAEKNRRCEKIALKRTINLTRGCKF